jgi:hypothetical protein
MCVIMLAKLGCMVVIRQHEGMRGWKGSNYEDENWQPQKVTGGCAITHSRAHTYTHTHTHTRAHAHHLRPRTHACVHRCFLDASQPQDLGFMELFGQQQGLRNRCCVCELLREPFAGVCMCVWPLVYVSVCVCVCVCVCV